MQLAANADVVSHQVFGPIDTDNYNNLNPAYKQVLINVSESACVVVVVANRQCKEC
jgi:hypothetical protein